MVPRRLLPQREFPPYAYVTGRFPHPVSDPRGHRDVPADVEVAPLDPANWRECPEYLFGLDLFNHGYYWEAHESWESLWHACGRQGVTADFLKALIRLAAAGVKAREGRPEGVRRHARKVRELVKAVANRHPHFAFAGLDLAQLSEVGLELEERPVVLPYSLAAVEVAFEFQLVPQ